MTDWSLPTGMKKKHGYHEYALYATACEYYCYIIIGVGTGVRAFPIFYPRDLLIFIHAVQITTIAVYITLRRPPPPPPKWNYFLHLWLLHEKHASAFISKVSVIQGLGSLRHISPSGSCNSQHLPSTLDPEKLPSVTRHKKTTAKDTAAIFQIMVAQSAYTEPQVKSDSSRLSLVY